MDTQFPSEARTAQHPAPIVPDHEMVRPIGRGSYGEVWLARNAVGTWRAVKVVYRRQFKTPAPYEREFAGIQKYEPLSRANEGLVDVLQIGRNDAGEYFYYVMELADNAKPVARVEGSEGARLNKTPHASPAFDFQTYEAQTLAQKIRTGGRLPVDECITLGLTLNLALGHLHRHGLIHRDVKPSNIIFVNGVAKLADIGLVIEEADARSYVGTEGFMPPDGPNSRHADLYALGKVLYEASMGKDRQDFPEPFTGALGAGTDSDALMEFNEILLKACDPIPSRRYQSAEEMTADLALLQSGRSVRDKHALERKLRIATRVAAGVIGLMILAVIPYFWAIKEARAARREAAKSRQVAKFLTDTFEAVGPGIARGRDTVLLRELMEKADKRVNTELQAQPEVQAELLDVIGQVFAELGESKLAEERFNQSLRLRTAFSGPDSLELARTHVNLAVVLNGRGERAQAEIHAKAALRGMEANAGKEGVDVSIPLESLAEICYRNGKLKEAIDLQKRALAAALTAFGPESARVAYVMDNFGVLLREDDKFDEAEKMHREALRISRKTVEETHPDIASELRNLANVLTAKRDFTNAEEFQKTGLMLAMKVYGATGKETALAINDLASTQVKQQKFNEARTNYQEALKIFRQKEDESNLANTLDNLATVNYQLGEISNAEACATQSVQINRGIFKDGRSLELARSLHGLAAILERKGDYTAAQTNAEECLKIREDLSPNSPAVFASRRWLARILVRQNKFENAQQLLVSAHRDLSRMTGTDFPSRGELLKAVETDLVGLYQKWGKPEKAAEWKKL